MVSAKEESSSEAAPVKPALESKSNRLEDISSRRSLSMWLSFG